MYSESYGEKMNTQTYAMNMPQVIAPYDPLRGFPLLPQERTPFNPIYIREKTRPVSQFRIDFPMECPGRNTLEKIPYLKVWCKN